MGNRQDAPILLVMAVGGAALFVAMRLLIRFFRV
jgi:hypothetical protein